MKTLFKIILPILAIYGALVYYGTPEYDRRVAVEAERVATEYERAYRAELARLDKLDKQSQASNSRSRNTTRKSESTPVNRDQEKINSFQSNWTYWDLDRKDLHKVEKVGDRFRVVVRRDSRFNGEYGYGEGTYKRMVENHLDETFGRDQWVLTIEK